MSSFHFSLLIALYCYNNYFIGTKNANEIIITNSEDNSLELIQRRTNENDVISLLENEVQKWEKQTSGTIIIPTSGGYDSRLLNLMISDKSRIRAFTYGISDDQSKSFEVVLAKKVTEVLGIKWSQIPLGEYHHFIDDWYTLFGVSSHAHGMYHIEFYQKIIKQIGSGHLLLSGFMGDAWAGAVNINKVDSIKSLDLLGYSHGMRADSNFCKLKSNAEIKQEYFEKNRELLKDPRYRVLEAMRMKAILLCYLFKVPESLNLNSWSPFLNQEISLAMLSLPEERKRNRVWQKELFLKHNLDVENSKLEFSRQNTLDLQALGRVKLKPLNVKLLNELFESRYIEWINKSISERGTASRFMFEVGKIHKIGGLLRKMGYSDSKLKAYNAYLTVKPIELLIEKRNKS